MVIGASPGSTGSGIKTTTFALFCASVRAIINRDEVEINGRTIPTIRCKKLWRWSPLLCHGLLLQLLPSIP